MMTHPQCPRDRSIQAIKQAVLYYNRVQDSILRLSQHVQDETERFTQIVPAFDPSFWTPCSSSAFDKSPCKLVMCGIVKAGKSSITNALLRFTVSIPVDDVPCTLRFTTLQYGTKRSLKLVRNDNNKVIKEVNSDQEEFHDDEFLQDAVAGERNAAMDNKMLENAIMEVPCDLLETGLQLIDTPGLSENTQLDNTFFDMIKKIRPTVVVFVSDHHSNGLGVNEIQFCDKLKRLQQPFSIILVINKIDESHEEWRRNQSQRPYVGHKYDAEAYQNILNRHFNQGAGIVLQGTSAAVIYDHNDYHTQEELSSEVLASLNTSAVVRELHWQFEMEIAQQIVTVAKREMNREDRSMQSLLTRVDNLTSQQLQEVSNVHEAQKLRCRQIANYNFPMRLKAMHRTIVLRCEEQLKQTWTPRTHTPYMRQLFQVNNRAKDIRSDVNELSREDRHSLIGFLVDRFVNVLIETLRKVHRLMDEEHQQFQKLVTAVQLSYPLHNDCKICHIIDEREREAPPLVVDVCHDYLQRQMQLDRGQPTLDDFLLALMKHGANLWEPIIAHLSQAFTKEEHIVACTVELCLKMQLTEENNLSQSKHQLAGMQERLQLLQLSLMALRSYKVGQPARTTHCVEFSLRGFNNALAWMEQWGKVLQDDSEDPEWVRTSQLLSVDYHQPEGEGNCQVCMSWTAAGSASQLLLHILPDLLEEEKWTLCKALHKARHSSNSMKLGNLCIHTLWWDSKARQLLHNPFQPARQPFTVTVLNEGGGGDGGGGDGGGGDGGGGDGGGECIQLDCHCREERSWRLAATLITIANGRLCLEPSAELLSFISNADSFYQTGNLREYLFPLTTH